MKTFELKKSVNLLNILLFVGVAFLASSCKTKKLDIYEPYKDITVVYGLLNPAESIQYIKINKGFLGEGDANIFAQEPDSINYNPADIEVSFIVYQKNGSTNAYKQVDTYFLKDTVLPVSDNSGAFTTKNNIVWFTRKPILSNNAKYTINIKNKVTGKVTTGETKIINLGDGKQELFSIKVYGRTGENLVFFDLLSKSKTIRAEFDAGLSSNANLYNLSMQMNYIEFPSQNIADSILKSVVYSFEQIKGDEASIRYKLDGSSLLNFFRGKKTSTFSDNTKTRKMRAVTFSLYAASPDFTTYIEVNAPRSGYILDKPIYSDITNGYGLFANRYYTKSPAYKFDGFTLKAMSDSLGINISKN
jgi:hypothetical protein